MEGRGDFTAESRLVGIAGIADAERLAQEIVDRDRAWRARLGGGGGGRDGIGHGLITSCNESGGRGLGAAIARAVPPREMDEVIRP